MIAVADTTPLNYLVQLGYTNILLAQFPRILIPPAVLRELQHPRAPVAVRNWIASPPGWLEVVNFYPPPDALLTDLDEGEAEAIQLAQHIRADRLLVDEALGRSRAQARGLPVIGTLGVLRQASISGALDMRKTLEQLQNLGFHVSKQVLEAVLGKDAAI